MFAYLTFSLLVFTEMKYALNALPETFINLLQVWFTYIHHVLPTMILRCLLEHGFHSPH